MAARGARRPGARPRLARGTRWAGRSSAVRCWPGRRGEAYFTSVLWDLASPPVPSPADAGYLLFPVLALRRRRSPWRARASAAPPLMAADASTAALAAGAVSAALVFGAVVAASAAATSSRSPTNLAYPVADLLLLGDDRRHRLALSGWRAEPDLGAARRSASCASRVDRRRLPRRGRAAAPGSQAAVWDAGWCGAASLWAFAAWTPAAARSADGADALGARSRCRSASPRVALAVLVFGGGRAGERPRRRARRALRSWRASRGCT